jgi:predicted XRE-type DNA-binding protein/phage-related protein
VRRVPAADEKPLHWVGSAKRDFLSFPAAVKDDMGNALGIAQFGGTAPTAKPYAFQKKSPSGIRTATRDVNLVEQRLRQAQRDSRNTMAKRRSESAAIRRGSKNVFEDLGYPDAAERQAKLRLAYALNQVLEDRQLSQADAAKVLGVTQPKVSALRHYKLAGFSVERLMNLLTALDRDVEIVIRRKPRSRKAGRISVVAA